MRNPGNSKKKQLTFFAIILSVAILALLYIIFFSLDIHKIEYDNYKTANASVNSEKSSSKATNSSISSDTVSISDNAPTNTASSDYLDKAVFTGDFVPVALGIYTNVDKNNIFADVNLSTGNIGDEKITIDNKSQTTLQAIKSANPDSIYICVGSNDLTWKTKSVLIKDYSNYINKLKTEVPNANIFVMSLTPVTENKDKSDKAYNNNKIKEFNSWIKQTSEETGVYYLDIFSYLTGDDGTLPKEFAESDGYHIKASGYKMIVNYILSHTSDANSESSSITVSQ